MRKALRAADTTLDTSLFRLVVLLYCLQLHASSRPQTFVCWVVLAALSHTKTRVRGLFVWRAVGNKLVYQRVVYIKRSPR